MISNTILRAVGKMINFSKNYAGSTGYPYRKKRNLTPSSHLTEKFSFGWFKALNMKSKQ